LWNIYNKTDKNMGFRTKLDFSDNRQVKQRIETTTILSGGTYFGVPYGDLPTGPNTNLSSITQTINNLTGTFSGNSGTTIFTWADTRMSLGDSSLSAITPSNSATTQNTGAIFTPDVSSLFNIDGNTGYTHYTGVSYSMYANTFTNLGGGAYSGDITSQQLQILETIGLDFTGRTIWNDVSGITRTQRLIITENPQVGYVWTCLDSEGMGEWQYNGSSSGSTIWTAGTGANSAVLGNSASIATGDTSVAEGTETIAGGTASHAEGSYTQAIGNNSHAEGQTTYAGGVNSHAEGQFTISNGPGGTHAEGESTTATGYAAHAEGNATIASGANSHAEGVVAIATGYAAHAEGNFTIASGANSHAEGVVAIASGNTSHAEGNLTVAGGNYSHAEGNGTIASGTTSHAQGNNTIAGGTWSHAEGSNTIASGVGSHAEGGSTIASGDFSHAQNNGNSATGNYSHAEGSVTLASGQMSHAEGFGTTASGAYSHAGGGSGSVASGLQSFVHGRNSSATNTNTIVFGEGITGTSVNTVYTNALNIKTIGSGTSLINLGLDSSGNVVSGSSAFTGYTYITENTGVGSLTMSTPTSITSTVTDIALGLTDTLSLDPLGINYGTGIKSEDTSNTILSQTNHTPTSILSTITDNGYQKWSSTNIITDKHQYKFSPSGYPQITVTDDKRGGCMQTSDNTTTLMIYCDMDPATTNTSIVQIKSHVRGISSDKMLGYAAEITSWVRVNPTGATPVTQIGFVDYIIKSEFTTASSSFVISGPNMYIDVTGEIGKTIDWTCNVELLYDKNTF
jgi:hypothetical protein